MSFVKVRIRTFYIKGLRPYYIGLRTFSDSPTRYVKVKTLDIDVISIFQNRCDGSMSADSKSRSQHLNRLELAQKFSTGEKKFYTSFNP